jgi:hypothetical protein
MKKALFYVLSSLALVLIVVFVIWARLSGNRWMIYVVPPLLIAVIFGVFLLIDKFSKKK